jgi:anti-sigma regulatory factor (Ser/Thr protein kinase)
VAEVASYQATAVEQQEPDLRLTDPAPVDARRAVQQLIDTTALSARDAEGLVGAISEVVTNASLHGRPPVELRGWVRHGAVTVTVTDRGDGPADPEVGHRPAEREAGGGGLGLWLARQMVAELVMGHDTAGFTVRLVAQPSIP